MGGGPEGRGAEGTGGAGRAGAGAAGHATEGVAGGGVALPLLGATRPGFVGAAFGPGAPGHGVDVPDWPGFFGSEGGVDIARMLSI